MGYIPWDHKELDSTEQLSIFHVELRNGIRVWTFKGEVGDSHHWLPGKPTEGHMPLISYHSGDKSDLKIETITSWCGAGD